MKSSSLVALGFALLVGISVNSCRDSGMDSSSNAGNTLRLSSNTITLSGSDTCRSVQASLTCGCSFMMEQMQCWGDTSCIRFNTGELGRTRNRQDLTATVNRSRVSGSHMSARLSFMVNDRMMGTMCRDTVTVDYYR